MNRGGVFVESNKQDIENEKTWIEKVNPYLEFIRNLFAILGISVFSIGTIALSIIYKNTESTKPTESTPMISSTVNNIEENTESPIVNTEIPATISPTENYIKENTKPSKTDDNVKYIKVLEDVVTLNVREHPDFNSSILTQIPVGEKYKVLKILVDDKNKIWYKIVIDKKTKGYVNYEYVEEIK